MDRKLLAGKRAHEGDNQDKPANDQAVCAQPWAQPEENLVGVLWTTVNHYFPEFNDWLEQLGEKRDQRRIRYTRQSLVWVALVMLLSKRGSRNQITEQLRRGVGNENLKRLSGQQELGRVAHGDTVEYYFQRSREDDYEQLQAKLIQKMLRGRVVEAERLLDRYYLVAIDGVQVHRFDYEHCSECLVRTHGAKKQWYHYKVQASLVGRSGICLPMGSEWVKNSDGQVKQDCEIQAFYRLIRKIRRMYKRMRICVVLDGLYAARPVFDLLKEQRMEWMVVFKAGSMPEAYSWVMDWKHRYGQNNKLSRIEQRRVGCRCRRTHQERLMRAQAQQRSREVITERMYTWLSGIKHWDGVRVFNVLTCREIVDDRRRCDYVWLVSNGLPLAKETVEALAQGGRCRWKIENEGINTQKNGGYALEHCYSRDQVAMKIWARMIDIAHLINQLIERGSLIDKRVYGSVKNIATRLFEHFRYRVFSKPNQLPRMQIRLCWDTS